MSVIEGLDPRVIVEVTLTHPAAAFAAMLALEGMSDEPLHANGAVVRVAVDSRAGAVMEAARRLIRAGVAADDIVARPRVPAASYRRFLAV